MPRGGLRYSCRIVFVRGVACKERPPSQPVLQGYRRCLMVREELGKAKVVIEKKDDALKALKDKRKTFKKNNPGHPLSKLSDKTKSITNPAVKEDMLKTLMERFANEVVKFDKTFATTDYSNTEEGGQWLTKTFPEVCSHFNLVMADENVLATLTRYEKRGWVKTVRKPRSLASGFVLCSACLAPVGATNPDIRDTQKARKRKPY